MKQVFSKVKAELAGGSYALVNAAGSMGGGQVGDVPLAAWWADFVSLLCFFFPSKTQSQGITVKLTLSNFCCRS